MRTLKPDIWDGVHPLRTSASRFGYDHRRATVLECYYPVRWTIDPVYNEVEGFVVAGCRAIQ